MAKLIACSLVAAAFLCAASFAATSDEEPQVMIIDLKDQTVGLRFLWSVPRSKIAQLPRWGPLREEVPLTPHKAATVATEFVRSHLPSVTSLSIFAMSLDRVGAGRDYERPELKDIWGYQISFRCEPAVKASDRAFLNVLVLFDGKVIVPTVSPLK